MRGLGGVGGGLLPGDADDAFAVGLQEGLAFGVVGSGLRRVVPLGAVGFDDEVVVGVDAVLQLGAGGSGSGWGARGCGLAENRSSPPTVAGSSSGDEGSSATVPPRRPLMNLCRIATQFHPC